MSVSPSTRNISPRSILVVETTQFPDILNLRYFGQDKDTGTPPRGGGGGQMSMKLAPPTSANFLDPTSIPGSPGGHHVRPLFQTWRGPQAQGWRWREKEEVSFA